MAYSETLAIRIRERFENLPHMTEKEMMGGLAFMYNNKMCVGIIKDEMMCRIDPELYEASLDRLGCKPMEFTGKPMKGWILIAEEGMRSYKDFDYWIELALAYNKNAKAAKKKKRK